VQGTGHRVQGAECRVQGAGCRVELAVVPPLVSGLGLRVGVGWRVEGLGFRV